MSQPGYETGVDVSEPETQFIPREDDDETLWRVVEITGERKGFYKVKWEGIDPKTGKPWLQSWVPKHDCTPDIVTEYKQKKKLAQTKKKANGRNRTFTSRASKTINPAKASSSRTTSTTAIAKRRSSMRTPDMQTPWDEPADATKPTKLTSTYTNGNKRRHSSTLDGSLGSREATISENSRPQKKRKLDELPRARDFDDEPEPPRPKQKRRSGSANDKARTSDKEIEGSATPRPLQKKSSSDRSRSTSNRPNGEKTRPRSAIPPAAANDVLSPPPSPPPPTRPPIIRRSKKSAAVAEVTATSPGHRPRSPIEELVYEAPESPPLFLHRTPTPEPDSYRRQSLPAPEPVIQTHTPDSLDAGHPEPEPVKEERYSTPQSPTEQPVPFPIRFRSHPSLSPASKARLQEFDDFLLQIEDEERQLLDAATGIPLLEADQRYHTAPNEEPPQAEVPTVAEEHGEDFVPETQPEPSSSNSHGQMQQFPPPTSQEHDSVESYSQEQQQPPPAEPGPAPPSTPRRTNSIIGRMKGRTPSKTPSRSSVGAPPLRPIPLMSASKFEPYLSAQRRADTDDDTEPEDESIEQWSSPERQLQQRRRLRVKRGRLANDEVERDSEDEARMRRGLELAEEARRKRREEREQEEMQEAPDGPDEHDDEIQEELAVQDQIVDATGADIDEESAPNEQKMEEEESTQDLLDEQMQRSAPTRSSVPLPLAEIAQEVEAIPSQNDDSQDLDVSMANESGSPRAGTTVQEMPTPVLSPEERERRSRSTTPISQQIRASPLLQSPDRGVQQLGIASDLLRAKTEQIAQLESELSAVHLQNAVLQRQRSRGLAVAELDVADLQAQLEGARAEAAEKDQKLELLETSIAALRSEKAELAQSGAVVGRSVEALEKERDDANRERDVLKAEREVMLRDRDTAWADADIKNVLLEKAKEQLSAAESERNAAVAAREAAEKSQDYFREQYALSEGANVALRDEKRELEKQLEIANRQTDEGISLLKATFEQRIRDLEKNARSWRDTAQFLIEKDRRSNSEEILQRAGQAPELAKKVEVLKERIRQHRLDIDEIAATLRERDLELEQLRGRITGENDVVFRCEWLDKTSNQVCGHVFQNVEDMQAHIYDVNHL